MNLSIELKLNTIFTEHKPTFIFIFSTLLFLGKYCVKAHCLRQLGLLRYWRFYNSKLFVCLSYGCQHNENRIFAINVMLKPPDSNYNTEIFFI